MPNIAKSLSDLKGQPMFQILAKCRELEKKGKRVLHFELGDPEFDTPAAVTEACIESLRVGNTHYMPARGDDDLIEAVRMTTGLSRGFIPDRNQITITTGANSAIFYSLKAVCDPGDEVLIPNPYFPSYLAAAEIAGAIPKLYNLDPAKGFSPDISSLESLITDNTRALLINSPSNPTGTVFSPADIKGLYELAEKHDLFIISDEVYARMVYDETCVFSTPSSIDSCLKRTIVINGFSKAFAMTGWRIGVAIAPHKVSEAITLLSESIVSCVPGFIQSGARAAILCPKRTTEKMYSVYRKRQKDICNQLEGSGITFEAMPQGSMYVFACIKKYSNSSEKFALHLLENAGVATVPGVYFGSQGEGYLRFSCAGSDDDIEDLGAYFFNAAQTYTGD